MSLKGLAHAKVKFHPSTPQRDIDGGFGDIFEQENVSFQSRYDGSLWRPWKKKKKKKKKSITRLHTACVVSTKCLEDGSVR